MGDPNGCIIHFAMKRGLLMFHVFDTMTNAIVLLGFTEFPCCCNTTYKNVKNTKNRCQAVILLCRVTRKSAPAFSFSGSISLAISSFLISAIVLGPFFSLVPEKPWPDSRSSKLASEALGLEPGTKGCKHRTHFLQLHYPLSFCIVR